MLRPLIAVLIGSMALAAGTVGPGALRPSQAPLAEDIDRIRVPLRSGRPKIVYSFNPDDDLGAIRRAGFTHVLVSYLQNRPDEDQRRKLDECRTHGLKLIYRLVDLVDRDRRAGSDALTQHAVLLLRRHPALAGWQTFEETNLPPATQIAVYHKIKLWDPDHPVLTVISNEYSSGWYRRTYSDDAQDLILIDYYPYKRRYDGWPYIHQAMRALHMAQKRPIPIIPVIQASASTHVASAEDTFWPPSGGLEKQINLWWTLGADAGVAFWVWRGSREYPFVGLADREAPAWALPETAALLRRILDGDLDRKKPTAVSIPAVRIRPPRENLLRNGGFEHGLEGWSGYNERASLTDQAFAGHRAVRMANTGAPKAIGIGRRLDVLVPPNASLTFSAYYRVVRETRLLQWMIDTTAYPRFGAAAFLEGKERLPVDGWQRASISVTNATGAPQRVKGVSILSTGFKGEVLLDNLQLERSPSASAYTDRLAPRASRLRFVLRQTRGRAAALSAAQEWTLSAWSALDVPPEAGDYACLASIEPRSSRDGGAAREEDLELRLRVDPRRSDPNGWSGTLELTEGASVRTRLPIRFAPGQPLFWSLSANRRGHLTLHFAPAGYRPAALSIQSPHEQGARGSATAIRAVSLGSQMNGSHPLNGRIGGVRLTPLPLPSQYPARVGSESGP